MRKSFNLFCCFPPKKIEKFHGSEMRGNYTDVYYGWVGVAGGGGQ